MALTFDATYYYKNRPDVLEAFLKSGTTLSAFEFALSHYNNHGWKEGANPSAVFNTTEYLNANPDVKAAGVNPFDHFNQHGLSEGRAPSLEYPSINEFDWQTYLNSNPDLKAAGITTAEAAYTHYINHGYAENRPGSPDLTQFKLQKALASLAAAQNAADEFYEGHDVEGLEELENALQLAEQALADARAEESDRALQAKLADAKDAAAAARAALGEADEAFVAKVAEYDKLAAELVAAKATRDALQDVADKAFDAFKAAQAENDAEVVRGGTSISVDGVVVAQFQPFNDNSGNGRVVLTSDGLSYEGLQALVDAINKALEASDKVNAAREARNEVRDQLLEDSDYGALFQSALDREQEVSNAEEAIAHRQKLIDDLTQAETLYNEGTILQDALDAAKKAITDLGFNLPTELADENTLTSDGDIFLYQDPADDYLTTALDGFGASGDDMIVFGKEFKLVKLDADTKITDGKLGDLAALEIFYQETATGNTVLYVEDDTWDGTAAGAWTGNTITLVGVDASSITFENGILRVAASEIA